MTLIGPRPQLVRDMVFMSEEQRISGSQKSISFSGYNCRKYFEWSGTENSGPRTET